MDWNLCITYSPNAHVGSNKLWFVLKERTFVDRCARLLHIHIHSVQYDFNSVHSLPFWKPKPLGAEVWLAGVL
jgi:hypothetical protein